MSCSDTCILIKKRRKISAFLAFNSTKQTIVIAQFIYSCGIYSYFFNLPNSIPTSFLVLFVSGIPLKSSHTNFIWIDHKISSLLLEQ